MKGNYIMNMNATSVLQNADAIATNPEIKDLPNVSVNLKLKDAINPLDIQLRTLEVKDQTVDGYFKQISYNWYIGAKATYFIARDLFLAKDNLSSNDYDKLKESLKPFLSRSTIEKYEKIGECDKLGELLQRQVLPMTWTTQYALATLSDEEFNKVLPILQSTTTMKEINQVLEKETEVKPSKKYTIEKPREFISIAYESGTADPNKMQSLVNQIAKLIEVENNLQTKYQTTKEHKDFNCEMYVNKELINKEEEKIINYFRGLEKSKSPLRITFPRDYADAKQLVVNGVNSLFKELDPNFDGRTA